MNARELFQAGKLNEAIQALGAELRDNPTDTKRRTFLFELLCFAGEYDRAEKQLAILAQEGANAEMGTLLYRGAIQAERTRQQLFAARDFPEVEPDTVPGSMDGKPFEFVSDSDPRIGARLEVFAAGTYLWLPFEHIASIDIAPPKRLRDLIWIPAIVRAGPSFKGRELGEVLIPVLSPLSCRHTDDAVRLGRSTVWEDTGDGPVPYGQKMLYVDDEEIPLLDVRKIEISAREAAAV
jgi:type VI secretion system protein ImpE